MTRRMLFMTTLLGALLVWGTLAVDAETIVEVVDQMGNTVQIPQPVERLASVYGVGTFYIYTLGSADRLVAAWYVGVKGISKASEAMFRLEPKLEEILCFGTPSVEEMVARNVELVMVDATRHSQFAAQMQELGIPVIQYVTETPETLRYAVRMTGRALGPDAEERAEAFCTDFDRVFSTVKAAFAKRAAEERVRVLFVGTKSLRVASGDMYQNDLIEAVGGILVSHDLRGYWNDVNLEQVLLWNPEVILIAPYGSVQPADFLDNPDWQTISAVRNRRVHRMPRVIAPWDTPVPESLLGVVWMADVFYPGEIDLTLSSEIERFYTDYYNYMLTEEELTHLTSR